jgi:formylglycine-generating enzyme required for sulfatase activity
VPNHRKLTRRELIQAAAIPATSLLARGQTPDSKPNVNPDQVVLPAPANPAEWPAFRAALAEWRTQARAQYHYRDDLYTRSDFKWVSSCYSCCFLMLCDSTFYNSAEGRYTVDGFLDRAQADFGGYDALVLWQAYPRIGVDGRNQFDFYRDMPGGLAGLREVTRRLHERNIKVFIDYNPWDTGTRREPVDDPDALVEILKAIDADGIFLDTLATGGAEFRTRLDQIRPGLVLEGEGALPIENIHDYLMSWAQWFPDDYVPGVLRNKWFERRHIQHQIARWDRDHTAELQRAWMNGSGMMVWENVFGSWVGWNRRDRSVLRSMLPIQRRYSNVFAGEGWTPLVPTQKTGVFASLWESSGLRLWTVVNRNAAAVDGAILRLPHAEGADYFDLIPGATAKTSADGASLTLSGTIPAHGIEAFLAGRSSDLGSDFGPFLASQRKLSETAGADTAFPALHTRLERVRRTSRFSTTPKMMADIEAVRFRLRVLFRIRECGFYDSQSDISLTDPSLHQLVWIERPVDLGRYAIDLTPVTNQQFADFLRASGYKPKHPENFLKHWSNGAPPPSKGDHPVVYVDIDDARAYARWANKRLPAEEEWQYAAAGPAELRYPWGKLMDPGMCNGSNADTTRVMAFPGGRSPFGCYDMCGNTWEWTESVREDGRTRFCILKGGSFYQAAGSEWYTDGGPQPNQFAAKFLLMWPGLDRCATIGFRCAVDLA